MKKLDINIIEQYKNGLTLRQIANLYDTNHHSIKRYLVNNGVSIERRYRSNVTEESRAKMSLSAKARGMNFECFDAEKRVLAMQASKLGTDRDLSQYTDRDKLIFLIRYTSKHKQLRELRFEFIDYFYNDSQLSIIWSEWKSRGSCKWWRPSLDHKIPLSQGGNFNMDNLQFLTWFENRAKADMTEKEWADFKNNTNTTSELFLRK